VLTRREFVVSAGGFALAVQIPLPVAWAADAPTGAPAHATNFVTAYLEIHADGTVTLHSPTTEMGQGTHTAHAVIVADELGVDLERVRVVTAEPADPFRRGGQMGSGGSWGVRHWYAPLRKAAAQAREMLLAAAAGQWSVPAGELTLASGEVLHAGSQRRIGIGALAAAAGQVPPPAEPRLRDKSEFRYTGRPVPRVDLGPKVRGEPVFASDIERPGTVYACPRFSPVFGAALDSFDRDSALAVPGVLDVVAIPGGAAVVAAHTWAAMRGAEALRIRFKPTPHDALDSATISRQMHAGLGADAGAIKAREDGDLAAVFAAAKTVVSADYEAPFLAHASMEPWNCNVEIDAEGVVHIWAPVQTQDRNRKAAAVAAGLAPEKVRLHTTYLGGGFGRRLGSDFIGAAVIVARAVKRPVKFLWRREDEFGQGWYRPAQVARMKAALDGEGRVRGLRIRTAGPSLGASFSPDGLPAGQVDGSSVQTLRDSLYKTDAFHVDWVRVDEPVPMAPWRAVGATQNGFFMECFLDEVARTARKDPYQLRRELLAHDPRALNVIDTAARAANWDRPLPAGRARGMAFVASYGSLCAEVAELSLRDGRPFVHRVVCALDCGSIVTPDGVRSQVEGGIVQGLSAALGEAVTIAGGAAENRNFDRYTILRMQDVPEKIDTIIIESGATMGGVGEPPLPPIAPAVANALYALTGKPVRKLPIAQEGLG
jgi:isoquinoline 1-oxidoreductase beta subunit